MTEINNLTTVSVDEEFLKKVIEKVLKEENKGKTDLSIALVGQGRMRKINKKYRGKNRATDVLAFPESKVLLEKFKIGHIQEVKGLGEVIICLGEVKKNAKKDGLIFEKELSQVLIHGVLHLLGYEHEKSKIGAEKMRKKEECYLIKCRT